MLRSLMLVALAAVPLHAGVIVVDPGGGPGGAALLQAALLAAAPGDVVLLREGDYTTTSGFVVSGKGLVVLADTGHDVHIPSLSFNAVPVNQTAMVRGLSLGPWSGGPPNILYAEGNGGAWIEDCSAVGADAPPNSVSATAAYFACQRAVVVVRGDFLGGDGGNSAPGLDATAGFPGLSCISASSAVFDVTAHGGRGGDGTFEPVFAPHGGAGIQAVGSNVFMLGGSFTGGDEGEAVPATTHGGPGASFQFIASYIRGGTYTGGGVTGAGNPGVPIESSFFGTVTTSTAPVRLLEITSPVREFGTGQLAIEGVPGDLAFVLLSPSMTVLKQAKLQGAQVVPLLGSTQVAMVGVVGAAGTLDVPFTLPALPPGVDDVTIFAQLATADAQGKQTLGGASALTWLSASF